MAISRKVAVRGFRHSLLSVVTKWWKKLLTLRTGQYIQALYKYSLACALSHHARSAVIAIDLGCCMSGHLPAFVPLQACERNFVRLNKGESSAFFLTILLM